MSQNYHQRPRDNMRTVCSAMMSDGLLPAISGAFPSLTAIYNRLFPPHVHPSFSSRLSSSPNSGPCLRVFFPVCLSIDIVTQASNWLLVFQLLNWLAQSFSILFYSELCEGCSRRSPVFMALLGTDFRRCRTACEILLGREKFCRLKTSKCFQRAAEGHVSYHSCPIMLGISALELVSQSGGSSAFNTGITGSLLEMQALRPSLQTH